MNGIRDSCGIEKKMNGNEVLEEGKVKTERSNQLNLSRIANKQLFFCIFFSFSSPSFPTTEKQYRSRSTSHVGRQALSHGLFTLRIQPIELPTTTALFLILPLVACPRQQHFHNFYNNLTLNICYNDLLFLSPLLASLQDRSQPTTSKKCSHLDVTSRIPIFVVEGVCVKESPLCDRALWGYRICTIWKYLDLIKHLRKLRRDARKYLALMEKKGVNIPQKDPLITSLSQFSLSCEFSVALMLLSPEEKRGMRGGMKGGMRGGMRGGTFICSVQDSLRELKKREFFPVGHVPQSSPQPHHLHFTRIQVDHFSHFSSFPSFSLFSQLRYLLSCSYGGSNNNSNSDSNETSTAGLSMLAEALFLKEIQGQRVRYGKLLDSLNQSNFFLSSSSPSQLCEKMCTFLGTCIYHLNSRDWMQRKLFKRRLKYEASHSRKHVERYTKHDNTKRKDEATSFTHKRVLLPSSSLQSNHTPHQTPRHTPHTSNLSSLAGNKEISESNQRLHQEQSHVAMEMVRGEEERMRGEDERMREEDFVLDDSGNLTSSVVDSDFCIKMKTRQMVKFSLSVSPEQLSFCSHFIWNEFIPFKKCKHIQLCEGSTKILVEPNAGGNSYHSEILSFEILSRAFSAKLEKTEMELEYCPYFSKKTDYSCKIGDLIFGVSVTRAMKFVGGDFTVEDAILLLRKKLYGIIISSRNVIKKQRWSKQILHIWCHSRRIAAVVQFVWKQLMKEDHPLHYLTSNTILMATVADKAPWIFVGREELPPHPPQPLLPSQPPNHTN